jgi:hypothetical protein
MSKGIDPLVRPVDIAILRGKGTKKIAFFYSSLQCSIAMQTAIRSIQAKSEHRTSQSSLTIHFRLTGLVRASYPTGS